MPINAVPSLRLRKESPVRKTSGDEQSPIHLDGFAARVAREENFILSLRDVVNIQYFFGMVAERLGRDSVDAIKPEKERDAKDDNQQAALDYFFAARFGA